MKKGAQAKIPSGTILLIILLFPFSALAKENNSFMASVNSVKAQAKQDIQSIKEHVAPVKEQAKKDVKSIKAGIVAAKDQAKKDVKPVKGWFTTMKEEVIKDLKSIKNKIEDYFSARPREKK